MQDLLIEAIGTPIIELSTRAIGGGAIALLALLLFANMFKRNEELKQYFFILILLVIFVVSGLLFITAMVNMQDIFLGMLKEVIYG